jgi:PAS domain S-box-containing protein
VAYENSFPESPWMEYMPEGHVRLDNVLFAPLNIEKKTLGVIGIANKPGGFNEQDVHISKSLGDLAALALTYAKSQCKLKNSEDLFRTIFEQSAVGIAQVTPDGRFKRTNSKFSDIIGYSIDELTTMSFDEITYPEDLNKERTIIELVRKGEIDSFEIEKRYIHKNGHLVWAKLFSNVVRDGKNNIQYAVASVIDITKRKIAETALQQSEERYRILFENTGEALFVAQDGRIVFHNPRSIELSGYSAEEFQSKPFFNFVHEDDREMVKDHHTRRLNGEKLPDLYAFRIIHKNGSILWTEINAVLIQWNEKPAVLCFMTDITKRREAEEALQNERTSLKTIIDSIPVMIDRYDDIGNILYLNKEFEKKIGWKTEELCNINLMEEVYPDPSLRQLANVYMEQSVIEWREFPIRTKSGEIVISEWSNIRLDDGTRIGIGIDVTERRRTEGELAAESAHRQLLMEHSRDGIVIIDQTGQVIESNRRFADMLGYPLELMRQLKVFDWEINHPPDRISEMINSVDEKGDFFESRHRRRDGSTYDVEISSNAAWFNGQKLIFCICRDITDRKQTEQSLAESEFRYKMLHNASFGGIAIHDQGIILECNYGLSEMTGYEYSELIGMNGLLLIAEKSRKRVMNNIRSGYEKPYEAMGLRKNGEEFPMQLEARNVPFKGKQVRTVEFRDITERKQAEAEREKLQEQLNQAQKMESIGSLAGGIAHDFNNILFPIVGLSEMMLDDFPPGSIEHQNLHEIFQAGKRGRKLIQQILSFSRQSKHQPIPVHIQKILKEALKLCRATIPADITITQEIKTDCGPVMADPTQIHQIAMNLITNAYHAVEPVGGTISIKLAEVDVTSTNDPAGDLAPGRYAVLSVSDTGIGIDEAIINKIFDPYFTTKKKGRGTGLGLATVYGIVKAHGGDIRVTSDIGKGTTFYVYLPLMEKSQELEPEKEKITPLLTGMEHILLVDDEKPIVHLEKQMLERLGYQTSVFISSREALAAFKTEPSLFDLVITDMNMPNMNGMQLATELIAVRPDIPIILCTGFSERIDNKKAEALGINGLLLKPVGMKDLAQKIQEVLDTTQKRI